MRADLLTLATIDFKTQLGKDVNILFFKPAHPLCNKNGLLLGFYAGESAAESPKFNINTHSYEGSHPGYNTLVARYTFDSGKK